MANGGRVSFSLSCEYCLLGVDGTLPDVLYRAKQTRSDRSGNVLIQNITTDEVLRVQSRRVLPKDALGQAIVIETDDKPWALCPHDGTVINIGSNANSVICPKCNLTFITRWIGTKPMTTTSTVETETAKAPKVKAAPKKVDFGPLFEKCSVWVKTNKFDSETIVSQAVTLIVENRMLCFNVYNGAAGAKEPAFDDFIAGTSQTDKVPWHIVKDLEKKAAQLTRNGYVTGEQAKTALNFVTPSDPAA